MIRTTLIILSSLATLTAYCQSFNRCEILQFSGEDSSKIKITKVITYDEQGRIISEKYDGYKKSASDGTADATYFYHYQDSLLICRTSIDGNKDSTKTTFEYNRRGLLKSESHFDYARRLRNDVDKGMGRPGGCIIDEEDYEKERTWGRTSIINYKYNKQGNKIEYYAPKVHWGRQNRYTWKYDAQNKITEHCSYEDSLLIWREVFSYSQSVYEFTRTWYDYEGNPQHLKEKKGEYWPQYKFTYKLDDQGREKEEIVSNEKGEISSTTTTEYNEFGMISKTVTYDKDHQAEITHIYKYKK